MLVIAAAPTGDGLRWSGRRHDDDRPGVCRGSSVADLFDAVFHALHDGEQVAVGFPAPLEPAEAQLASLLTEIRTWRPWTVVTTSLQQWRATTSVLVWETETADLDAAVDAFFGRLSRAG